MSAHVDRRKAWIANRRHKRKHARRARVHRQLFRYVLLLAILYGGITAFARLPWSLEYPVDDVLISGNNFATADQIRASLGNLNGKLVYQIDPRRLERKAESLPAVKFAFVRRCAFPKPKIALHIMEEFPWATFAPGVDAEPVAVIAQSGKSIPLQQFPNVYRPALMIYGPKNLKLGYREVSQWTSWTGFIAAQTGHDVESIDMQRPFDVRVQDGDLYLKLGAPDGSMTRRLGRLASVLNAIEPMRARLQYIDLALDNNIPLKLSKKDPESKRDHTQQASSLLRTL